MSHSTEHTHEHDTIWLLLPWYANGRIGEQQRHEVDEHLRSCQACQDELRTQRQLCRAMADSSPEIEQLPTASLRRLMQSIDAHERSATTVSSRETQATTIERLQRGLLMRLPRTLAASLVLFTVMISAAIVLSHIEQSGKAPPANYYTVTSPAPVVASEVIRVVFAPTITVAEMQTILNEAQLSIVAGPTPAGVYSLAKTGTQTVRESLLHLRSHQQILFAEPSALIDTVASQ